MRDEALPESVEADVADEMSSKSSHSKKSVQYLSSQKSLPSEKSAALVNDGEIASVKSSDTKKSIKSTAGVSIKSCRSKKSSMSVTSILGTISKKSTKMKRNGDIVDELAGFSVEQLENMRQIIDGTFEHEKKLLVLYLISGKDKKERSTAFVPMQQGIEGEKKGMDRIESRMQILKAWIWKNDI